MGRWTLTRVAFGLSLLAILLLQSTPVAHADNCSSLSDCFSTTDAAATVTVAVAVLIAIAVLALPQLLETSTLSGSDAPEPLPEPESPLPLPPVPPVALPDSENRSRQEGEASSTPSYSPQQHASPGKAAEPQSIIEQPSPGRPAEPQPSMQQPGHLPAEAQAFSPPLAQVQHPLSHTAPEVQISRSEPEIQVSRSDVEVQVPRPESELQAPFIPLIGPDAPAEPLLGIHHVTAIAGDPQRNIDFYTGLLGFRLVKATVNFDQPNTYHFYYGDMSGNPGTILSFLCWPTAQRGSRGTGQVISLAFSVPEGSLNTWAAYITGNGITVGGPTLRFTNQVLSFFDPDGLQIDLVAHYEADEHSSWNSGGVPPEAAIRGLHSVSIAVTAHEQTAALLCGVLGFQQIAEAGNRRRYQTGDGKPGTLLDVVSLPMVPGGSIGTGIVHHLSWRTPGNAQQLSWRYRLSNAGLNVSPVTDHLYYQSLYFYEPGGVLLDIATDTPGFTIDERPEQLGTHLMLPAWLEPHRTQITQTLPPLRLPSLGQGRQTW
jgi:glyoxalase family protein